MMDYRKSDPEPRGGHSATQPLRPGGVPAGRALKPVLTKITPGSASHWWTAVLYGSGVQVLNEGLIWNGKLWLAG
jgi:hypothetical protein